MVELIKIFVIATSFAVLNAHAFDSIYDDQAVMLNFKVPFSENGNKPTSPTLELRFNSVQSEFSAADLEPKYEVVQKPALIELPLGQEGIHGLKVGGRYVMLDKGIYAVDGDTQSSNTGLIIVGIILVGVVIGALIVWENTEDELEECLLQAC